MPACAKLMNDAQLGVSKGRGNRVWVAMLPLISKCQWKTRPVSKLDEVVEEALSLES
jgi:hypothetical protein